MSETDAGAFDATGYRQRVLATLRGSATLDLSDPFFVVDLPVDVDDEAMIRARIVALVGFWNKERSPNYKTITAELARHRADLEAVLLDPARRSAAAAKVRAARAAADADRYGALDDLAAKLVARYQGLPRSRLPGLARLARSKGLDDAAFAAWVASHPVIEDGADAEPLPASLRAQIRSDLDEFGRLAGDPSRATTLWSFLGLPPTASDAEVAARSAELSAQNDLRQHDHQMTVAANLLTYARQHLMAADRPRYTASLVEDAKDRLRDEVAEKVIVDGELSAADYEACVLRALGFGFGLSTEQARAAVRQVATDLGATLAVAPAMDLLVCPNCREPQPASEHDGCRYCGADLFIRCPFCDQRAEAAAAACTHCGASFQAIRAAQEQLTGARAELERGQPSAARIALAAAERAAARAPGMAAEISGLGQEIGRVIAAAKSDWQAADRDLAAHRIYGAMDRLSRIARTAADVPGPAGQTAQSLLGELADRKAAVQAQLAAARGLPDSGREAALGQVLAVAADCQEAIDLLAAIPMPAPSGLRAQVAPDAVQLRWNPVPGPGPVTYKVVRVTTAPDGSEQASRSLGSTSSTQFEDAGVPGGVLVAHEVTATSGHRASAAARTTAALMARDVAGLRARTEPGAVTLTWSLPISYGKVVIERQADPGAPVKVMPRRDIASGGSWRDVGPAPGVEFVYHVFAEYRDAAGQVVRTPGATVRETALPPSRQAQ